jgi:hypothetical protein
MKHSPFKNASLLSILVISCLTSNVRAIDNTGYNLELTIHCTKTDIKQGDEIPIVFTITNKGNTTYRISDRNYDRSGRFWEYQLFAAREDGNTVADPRKNRQEGLGGGLGGSKELSKGESYVKTIALNRWALIKEPGHYTVTGTYYPESAGPNDVVKSPPIEIVVGHRGYQEMGEYIKKLVKELEATKDKYQRESIIQKLEYTCDSRIAPAMIELMYETGNDGFWAAEAFGCYLSHDSETKKAVFDAVSKRGLPPYMGAYILEQLGFTRAEVDKVIQVSLNSKNSEILGAGVRAAQNYPNDSFMPRLIEIATDPNCVYREAAIFAIAFNRTDEGVKTLKALLTDKDKGIRKYTGEAIRRAYERFPVYPEHYDEEFTAELVKDVQDVNHPRFPGISRIVRTRTKEGVEAMKMLLVDPNYDSPIVQSDQGVKAIKLLLQAPDKEVRKAAAFYIKEICCQPGRPLRQDDFPDEFKENPDEYKKKILELLRKK